MPIRTFKCSECGEVFQALKPTPEHCGVSAEVVLCAPQAKFLECTSPEKRKSALKGQRQILQARAKEHSRSNDLHDAIQANDEGMAKRVGWLREDGRTRKRIDDL